MCAEHRGFPIGTREIINQNALILENKNLSFNTGQQSLEMVRYWTGKHVKKLASVLDSKKIELFKKKIGTGQNI